MPLHRVACIIPFSILGTFTRLALVSLNSYPGHRFPPLLWAQFVGCAFMGFLTADKCFFDQDPQRRYVALHIGLTVGFCGSLTTFSGYILDCFKALSDFGVSTQLSGRPAGYNILDLFFQLVATPAFSFVGFHIGTHLARALSHLFHPKIAWIQRPRSNRPMVIIACLAIVFWALVIVAAAVWSDRYWRGHYTIALAFSPLGALLRFAISLFCARQQRKLIYGTFTANMLGTTLEAVFFILQTVADRGIVGGLRCQILQALQDGFCGTLTTISTLTLELITLETRRAWGLGSFSVAFGLFVFLLVDGIPYWTRGSSAGPGLCRVY